MMNAYTVTVKDQWNGTPSQHADLWAKITLQKTSTGLQIQATMPVLAQPNNPAQPPKTRVDNLWEYDVAEVFLVGDAHNYMEIEIGPLGHYLVLSFDEIRQRSDEHTNMEPIIEHVENENGTVTNTITIPFTLLPRNIRAMNAFVISRNIFLAAFPLPGDEPDFHQPDAYPSFTF